LCAEVPCECPLPILTPMRCLDQNWHFGSREAAEARLGGTHNQALSRGWPVRRAGVWNRTPAFCSISRLAERADLLVLDYVEMGILTGPKSLFWDKCLYISSASYFAVISPLSLVWYTSPSHPPISSHSTRAAAIRAQSPLPA
jgi:hypothetical protein